jgi:AcrR family transcriptional regulator
LRLLKATNRHLGPALDVVVLPGHHEHMIMNERSHSDDGRAGGKRAEAGDEIRARLLDAAEALLAERQPGSITSRDIARRAGASVGVLYNHYADKHDLLLRALVRRFALLLTGFATDPPAPGHGTVADGIAGLVRRSHELQLVALPMLANLVGDPPLLGRFLMEIHRPPLGGVAFHQPIADYLSGERRLGRIGPIEPDAVADVLVGAVLLQGLIDVLGHRPPADAERHLAGVTATILAALGPIEDHPSADAPPLPPIPAAPPADTSANQGSPG